MHSLTAPADRWFTVQPDPAAPLRLFCFPHAGAGGSAYRPWAASKAPAGAGVHVCPVQLPGRENRFGETPYRSLDPLLDALMPALAPHLDRPFALFGHSLGALVAFELTRSLTRAGRPLPTHLLVSGRIAPQLTDPRPVLHDLPDTELLAALAGLGGVPRAVLDDPALMELMALQLPLIRADLAVNETYRHVPGPALPVPVTAYGGDTDPKVAADELRAWHAQTDREFRARLLPGGHFFVQSELFLQSTLPELLRHLLDDLRAGT